MFAVLDMGSRTNTEKRAIDSETRYLQIIAITLYAQQCQGAGDAGHTVL